MLRAAAEDPHAHAPLWRRRGGRLRYRRRWLGRWSTSAASGRAGFKVMGMEAGPFWDTERDWVSDEAGSNELYWEDPRVTGGKNPLALGANNSGKGVGGGSVHWAAFAPRFHPSDFRLYTRDGVGADWPITYGLSPCSELLNWKCRWPGPAFFPWGDPHGYPFGPHPMGGVGNALIRGCTAESFLFASAARWPSFAVHMAIALIAYIADSVFRAQSRREGEHAHYARTGRPGPGRGNSCLLHGFADRTWQSRPGYRNSLFRPGGPRAFPESEGRDRAATRLKPRGCC